jgi:uncharacterized membrane protein
VLPALLGVSLALNAALLAFPGMLRPGTVVASAHPPRAERSGFERMVGRIEASLPVEDRPAFRQVMEAERSRYAPSLEAVRQARRGVDEAIRRDPFDEAALRAALEAFSARWVAFNDAFGETLVHALAAVSPAGRAQVAAARSRDGG